MLHANWKHDKTRIAISLYDSRWRPRALVARDLIAAAAGASLRVFPIRYDIYDDDYPPPSPAEFALQSPHVLLTPPAMAQRLGKTTFALWSDALRSTWYLSTARTTVRLGGDDASRLHFYDIAPARGGGYMEIGTTSWSVRDAHGSSSMKDALAALESLPGLTIIRYAGHDA